VGGFLHRSGNGGHEIIVVAVVVVAAAAVAAGVLHTELFEKWYRLT